MPYNRPSRATLIARVVTNLYQAMPGLDPSLGRQVTTAVGAAIGDELNSVYGYLDFIFQMFYVRTAAGQYLDDRGNPFGISREQATNASGTIAGSGGTAGTELAVGAALQSSDGTVNAVVATLATVAGDGTISVAITTTTTGTAANEPFGTVFNLVVAQAGIPASFTVSSANGLTGGAAQESDDDYRVRILARMQKPPQGGANRDYISWTKDAVNGVTRVWVFPLWQGLGTVGVASVFDGRAPNSIVPTAEDLVALQAAIAPGPVAPTCALPSAVILTLDAIPVVLGNLQPVTGFTQAQALANATASLQALFGLATPGGAVAGDGVTGTPTNPVSGTTFLEDVSDAVTESLGVGSFDLIAPTADIVSGYMHLAQLGAVTTQ